MEPPESLPPVDSPAARWLPDRNGLARSLRRFWREWVRPFIIILIAMGSFRSAVADWNHVPTGSMKPTILIGDRILVNKLAYDLKIPFTRLRLTEWAGPERGDLIVFLSPADGKRLVKRVIGVPGDEIEMRDNRLIVNGTPAVYRDLEPEIISQLEHEDQERKEFNKELLEESVHPIMRSPYRTSKNSFGRMTVPQESYFVMGDNRDESFDSRWFGVVSRDLILGRATAVAISMDPNHFYLPRWDRFFDGLP
jgi:signal peptidase I